MRLVIDLVTDMSIHPICDGIDILSSSCYNTGMIGKLHYVYSLIDPRDRKIRHLGFSTNPKPLIYNILSPGYIAKHPSKRSAWLLELYSKGMKPICWVKEGTKTECVEKFTELKNKHLSDLLSCVGLERGRSGSLVFEIESNNVVATAQRLRSGTTKLRKKERLDISTSPLEALTEDFVQALEEAPSTFEEVMQELEDREPRSE